MIGQLFKRNDLDVPEPDGFTLKKDDPLYGYHLLISKYLRNLSHIPQHSYQRLMDKIKEELTGFLNQDKEMKVQLVTAASIRLAHFLKPMPTYSNYTIALRQLLIRLLGSKLPFTQKDLVAIFHLIADNYPTAVWAWPINSYLRQVKYYLNKGKPDTSLRGALLLILRALMSERRPYSEHEHIIHRLEALLFVRKVDLIEVGEAWTDTLLADHEQMSEADQDGWNAIFNHAINAKAAKPNPSWLKKAKPFVEKVGRETAREYLLAWLSLMNQNRNQPMTTNKTSMLKGLVWFCSFFDDEAMKRALVDTALACYHKIPQRGERSRKAGNACIHVLGNRGAISELSQLRLRIKTRRTRNFINDVLETAAQKAGITITQLEEISVPTFGLTGPGVLERQLGDFTAELRIEGNSTTLKWRNANGKWQKSVPATVRRDYGEALNTLKRAQKDIRKMLPAQRGRIENFLSARDQRWGFESWRKYYLDHPLLAPIVRRLIWQFEWEGETTLGIWYEDQLVDINDQPLEEITADTVVRLWHPLGFDVDLVREWRAWLLFHEVRQPFKQAHREIYLLTDAELRTETYSNRFAAHLLRQHQFNALCQERGWHYQLEGAWDSGSVPTLYRSDWGMIAQFWVQPVHSDDWDSAYANSGIALFISTDQIRFYNRQMGQIPLEEVPARFFSEVLRDVDLFVGVCSVGNDPNWEDRGGLPGYGGYWQSYAFGDLTVSAEIRKELLQSLIPRLKIAPLCSFVGKFLIVKGKWQTYKIHLGSGNILMEPNDQYLCIVPDRRNTATGKANKVFLPFDGDIVTSTILSKAFLLAEDDKITDLTITRQIGKPAY